MMPSIRLLLFILTVLCGIGVAPAIAAQPSVLPAITASAPETPVDALGRQTPKGMIQGFLKAVGSESYEQATGYLDLSDLPPARQKEQGANLARDLQTLLDQGGWVEAASKLSDSPEGDPNDGLEPKVDSVGTIRAGKKEVALLAERKDDPENGAIWQISNETIASIPKLLREMALGPLDRMLPDFLIDNKIYGVPAGHWLALFLIATVSLLPALGITFGLMRLIHRIWAMEENGKAARILDAFVLPLKIYIALGTFALLVPALGISIVARQHFILIAEIAGWLSLWWLMWRIVDIVAHAVQARLILEKKQSALSSVIFFRRSARFILAATAIALAMDKMGLNVGAWLTALGIGGLALAFGAQKTIENFVVGLTLILDQPFRIDDFCKIGEIRGTVEDIGMRSVRLRTPDNTVMTVPNGSLSSITIENFSQRSKFWFHPLLALGYETTAEQIRQVLAVLQNYLDNHIQLDSEKPRHARLISLGRDAVNVEISAYIVAIDHAEYLKIQQEMLLRMIEIVGEHGLKFALPTQMVHVAKGAA